MRDHVGGSEGADLGFEGLMEVVLLLRAEADLLRIFSRYEDIHSGRGVLFLAAFERSLNQLKAIPESAPLL